VDFTLGKKMKTFAIVIMLIMMVGCNKTSSRSQKPKEKLSLRAWSQQIYTGNPTRHEELSCETDDFLFSLCSTEDGWIGIFFRDKRDLGGKGVASTAYFVSHGRRLDPIVGDAGDGRIPNAKFIKTSQKYDGLTLEYQVFNGSSAEFFEFQFSNGRWIQPK
jgi:hypothetical protein